VCCSVVQCGAVCCSVLQCVAVCCSVLQCGAVCCSMLQCVAVCCRVLQGVAVCCSMMSRLSPMPMPGLRPSFFRCVVAECCSVVWYDPQTHMSPSYAMYLTDIKHILTHRSRFLPHTRGDMTRPYVTYLIWQHTAAHCNILQHTATHCNTICDISPLHVAWLAHMSRDSTGGDFGTSRNLVVMSPAVLQRRWPCTLRHVPQRGLIDICLLRVTSRASLTYACFIRLMMKHFIKSPSAREKMSLTYPESVVQVWGPGVTPWPRASRDMIDMPVVTWLTCL